jgi:PAS domain S-box-containing protein
LQGSLASFCINITKPFSLNILEYQLLFQGNKGAKPFRQKAEAIMLSAQWQQKIAGYLSWLIIGLSGLILVGWVLQLRPLVSLGTGLISIKANTALCFLAFSLATLLIYRRAPSWMPALLAFSIMGLSTLVIAQDLLGRPLGVDEFFFQDFDFDPSNTTGPGRMSPFTAISFVLLGFSLISFDRPNNQFRQPAILAVYTIGMITLISYPFKASSISGLFALTTMAVQTAILLILSASTLFLLQPDTPLKRTILAPDSLGRYTRQLLLAASVIPFLLGWIVNVAETQLLVSSQTSEALIVIGAVLLLVIVVLNSSQHLRNQSDRRQIAELDFRNTQLQLEAVLENSPSAIFTKSADGSYQLVNRNFAALVDLPREAILGQTSRTIFPPEIAEQADQEDQQILSSGQPMVTERRFRQGESELILQSTKFPLLDHDGNILGIGGIWTDVSERARLVEDLRRSNAELEQFAYVASHDLQEPLRMVSSYMQLLESRYRESLDQDAKEFIDFAVDGANRMQRLIQDLLAFSRVGTRGKGLEPIQTREALDLALRNLTNTIDQNQVQFVIEDLPEIKADLNQVVQVFQNIIANAIKFRSKETPRIQIVAQPNLDMAQFSITDNGIGFDTKHADRIFVIFQRLNNRSEYGGTGIGLAICKKIVERHGGRIWVESREGHGSTFHFTLPLTESAIRQLDQQKDSRKTIQKERAETVEERAGRML